MKKYKDIIEYVRPSGLELEEKVVNLEKEVEELKKTLEQKFEGEGLKLIFRHVHAESDVKEVEFLDVNHVIDKTDLANFILLGK